MKRLAWRVNLSTSRAFVPGEAVQRFVDVFERDGADGLAVAMDSQLPLLRGHVVMVFADPSKRRLVGSLPLCFESLVAGFWHAGARIAT